MGVYTDTILTIDSENTEFVNQLFTAISPTDKPSAFAALKMKLFGKEHHDGAGLMGFLLPMPEHLEKTVSNGYGGESPEWRNWRIANWGCPHDAGLELCKKISDQKIKMRFTSYNGDTIPGLTTAAKIHSFRFCMLYHCDHGAVGRCTESNHDDYEFPGVQPPHDAGIPKELIDAFDLDAVYASSLEE